MVIFKRLRHEKKNYATKINKNVISQSANIDNHLNWVRHMNNEAYLQMCTSTKPIAWYNFEQHDTWKKFGEDLTRHIGTNNKKTNDAKNRYSH